MTFGLLTCQFNQQELNPHLFPPSIALDTTIYTPPSLLENSYVDFNSPNAINAIADMENDYFRKYNNGISKYYGTEWRTSAEKNVVSADRSLYDTYLEELGTHADSMHCTIYAVKALKSGMDSLWNNLEASHNRIYQDHEHAGWSIARILVKEFNWKAYLIMDAYAEEFNHCKSAYERNKSYPVWNQPDIPLEAMFIRDDQDSLITDFLSQHEFGWGFSKQGYHTWFTRFTDLKECIWYGAPSGKYELMSLPLFRTTPFLDYFDYNSHVVVFPPKKE